MAASNQAPEYRVRKPVIVGPRCIGFVRWTGSISKEATVLLCMSGSLMRPICQKIPLGSYWTQLADQARETTMENVATIHTSSVGVKPEIRVIPVAWNRHSCLFNYSVAPARSAASPNPSKAMVVHTRGKRVDGKRLARLPTGDSRVFIQREEMLTTWYGGSCAAWLQWINEPYSGSRKSNHGVLGIGCIHYTEVWHIAASMFPGIGGRSVRYCIVVMPVRSGLGRFAVCSSGGTPLAEAMLYAARELVRNGKRQRKGAHHHHRWCSKWMGSRFFEQTPGHVDTYAIGIGSTTVSQYFENGLWSMTWRELQKALFSPANFSTWIINLNPAQGDASSLRVKCVSWGLKEMHHDL